MRPESKKSFVLYLDSLDILDELSKEQKADLFDAIRDYHYGNEIKLQGLMKAVFIPFKNQFERDDEKYQKICDRNSKNGSKGGRPKKPKKPTGFSEIQNKPKKADNDSDSVNDNEIENKTERVRNELSPLDFLIETCKDRLNAASSNYLKISKDKREEFKKKFNSQVELEIAQGKIRMNPDELIPRFKKFTTYWISNEDNYGGNSKASSDHNSQTVSNRPDYF